LKPWLLFVCFPLVLWAQPNETNVRIQAGVKIRLETEPKNRFLADLDRFLELKDADFTTYRYVDSLNYTTYKDLFDALKFIEVNAALNDSNYYRPYLVNFVEQAENTFLVSLSFRGSQNGEVDERARMTFLAQESNHTFKFLNPFEFYTKDWNTRKIKNAHFYYRGAFNEEEAEAFANHNEFLAALWNMESRPIRYYKCLNLQEVYQLMGIDYHVDINGVKRGCVTLGKANLFVSGTNREEYKHDLTHFYFELQVPQQSRNWVAEEGYNINLTDYWGFATKENYGFLKQYLAENGVTPLEIFEKNRIMKSPISTKMPVAALIMRKIEREKGMDGVLQVITCGTTDDDFFKAIETVAHITKENFNEVVEEELKKYFSPQN